MNTLFSRKDAVIDMGSLPDLLTFNDGRKVTSSEEWRARRKEVFDAIIPVVYGLPPDASACEIEIDGISTCAYRPMDGAEKVHLRICVKGGTEPLYFDLFIYRMVDKKLSPVVLNGDGCFAYLVEDVIIHALKQGFAVVQFDRCEIARDTKTTPNFNSSIVDDLEFTRNRGIYRAFPGSYGTLAAWAWGYSRAVDVIEQIPYLDAAKIMVTGHSRGGKTVELAAALDERIAIVADNNSGCCGFSSSKIRGSTGGATEDIKTITCSFPTWFADGFDRYADKEDEMPFDQHFLAALIAPRPLRMQVALGDHWSNPVGACVVYNATKEVYDLLNAGDNLNIIYREGAHYHRVDDWTNAIDYAKTIFAQ